MRKSGLCLNALVVCSVALWSQSAICQADELNAQAESGGADPFHIDSHTTSTLGSISAFASGAHGSAGSTSAYGSLSLSVHSFSDSTQTAGNYRGGTYSAGSVDFGDAQVQQDYWLDSVTVDPTVGHLAGSAGTLQITYALSGLYSVSNITTSPASGWSFITNNTNIRHIDGFDSVLISDFHTITDTVGFTYGTPFTIQGGIAGFGATDGSQSAVVNIQLSLRETNLTVLSGGNPIDFTSSSNAGSAASRNVLIGGSYAGFTLQNTSPYGHGSTLTILGGTASANKSLNATFTGAPGMGGSVASDVVNFSGTTTDQYVLELSYDPATANALYGTDANLALTWFNGSVWVNAVADDSDGGAASQKINRAYNPATDFVLGNYGIDTTNHVVWAVVDHNSDFAVAEAVPEPGTWAALLSGVGMLALFRRRGR